ncbi:molecular chaperone TorD family protein [Calidifontibacillus oryziterrae]|uniref:molecular chaperone TorD family protein n=1 Tax=Calidifontibacillus oryziterrae TaxID=1191699 RepID=UPI0003064189|nr:molecular chaperone TorD family protein [Calidifontibacillus oryziterrae]
MNKTKEEQYGKLALTNILTTVWLGDWDRYEEIFQSMDKNLEKHFPFHINYNRENVKLWHENYFSIPGDYFVSPYFSSYMDQSTDPEERKKNLLCLIGAYENMGFYFPLDVELYPDHIGCLTAFIGAVQQEKIKAYQNKDYELMNQLSSLEEKIGLNYIIPAAESMQRQAKGKIHHPFFKQFLVFYSTIMKEEYIQH